MAEVGGDGEATSLGFNLFGDLTDKPLTPLPSDVVGEDPLLGELMNNGGFTPTMALGPASPAKDAIPEESCLDSDDEPLLVDQRGRARPAGGGCDIGAFEL